ncbi:MAG TPA: pyruvate kinase alpha/beta domain-containing protein [Candidatus Edwardsbacteria bacterium]|nr:pyruvate kinase alpha/beta domain-containing protein [Candidatus Edwardsbacteria bacterium]
MAIYFERPGPHNTDETLKLAKQRADELGIRQVVVATTSGAAGAQAAAAFQGYDVVVVTHSAGFAGKDAQELTGEHRTTIESLGARVLTCQHALGGVNRAVRFKLKTYQTDEIIAYTLRTMGQGFKVCAEIAMMAADAGLVSVQREAVCIGGTGHGADTAVVLTPVNAQDFFDLKVHEVICKPRL